jgi:hypothetical protein
VSGHARLPQPLTLAGPQRDAVIATNATALTAAAFALAADHGEARGRQPAAHRPGRKAVHAVIAREPAAEHATNMAAQADDARRARRPRRA